MPETPQGPPHFEGTFLSDLRTRRIYATASGPFLLEPVAVATPRSTEDAWTLLSWARSSGTTLVARGAGTGMPAGNVGRGVSVDLMPHFGDVGPVDPETRTVRAGAGARLGDVDRLARRHGLFIPPLPSSADRCSVGGAVANNAAGARTFRFGSVRDRVVEASVLLGEGTLVRLRRGEPSPPVFDHLLGELEPDAPALLRGWPSVRKNSSGYALDRFLRAAEALDLIAGSEGTLGLVLDVTLSLEPLPPARAVALFGVAHLDQVLILSAWARETGATAFEYFGPRFLDLAGPDAGLPPGPSAGGAMLVELAGTAETVRAQRDSLEKLTRRMRLTPVVATRREERERAWNVRHGASPRIAREAEAGRVSTQFIEDSVVPPRQVAAYASGVGRILSDVGFDAIVFGHAGDGNVHVNPLVPVTALDARERVRAALAATVDLVSDLGGTLSGEHGDGRLRAPLLDRIWSPLHVEAFRTVKRTLDPDGVLNPGVILPEPGQDPLDGLWSGLSITGEVGAPA